MALTKKQVIDRLSVSEARAALEAAIARTNKATEKRNRAFAKLSGSRKRITVARDVLEQLRLRRFVATTGTYLQPTTVEAQRQFNSFDDDSDKRPVHEVLEDVKCQVCGIGSLFVAAVDRANACTIKDMNHSYENSGFMREYLGGFFSDEQLVLIETAFEKFLVDSLGTGLDEWSPEIHAAIAFGAKYSNAEKRLKSIMENIIEHKGTFVP
jgi:hypothetical protein